MSPKCPHFGVSPLHVLCTGLLRSNVLLPTKGLECVSHINWFSEPDVLEVIESSPGWLREGGLLP